MMNTEKKTIALLSNVTVSLITSKLRKYNFYIPEGYDTWLQDVINPTSILYSTKLDAIIILLDGTEARTWKNNEGSERINLWKQAVNALVEKMQFTPIFISTIDIRENKIKSYSEFSDKLGNDWYFFIKELSNHRNNIFILDIVDIITEIGRKQFYSNKMWYISDMPYSREGLAIVSKEINRALSATFESRKKIIALDLDNTLWGGVIGEDGIEGIELSDHKEGQRYYDFQRQLLEMKNRGILLAINSKNNPEDAEIAIQNHPAMLLKDEDFVSRKINWNSKAANIKSMESDLNLTEGSFIFIDDNPLEREAVKLSCPDALVADFPTDTTELLAFAEEIWCDYCKPLKVLSEDVKKTQMYQAEEKRKLECEESLNLDDYIAKLEIIIDIHRMRLNELERTVQLINKTNQFNLTTKRYTQAEIQELIANPNNTLYVVHSSDKYGDNGLISVIILRNNNLETKIDTFLMSCRVMGRRIENVIIDKIAEKNKILIGEYIPTAKNAPVKDLYENLGFNLIEETEAHRLYRLTPPTKVKDAFQKLFKEIKFDEN